MTYKKDQMNKLIKIANTAKKITRIFSQAEPSVAENLRHVLNSKSIPYRSAYRGQLRITIAMVNLKKHCCALYKLFNTNKSMKEICSYLINLLSVTYQCK